MNNDRPYPMAKYAGPEHDEDFGIEIEVKSQAEIDAEAIEQEQSKLQAILSDPALINGFTMSKKTYEKQQFLIGPGLLPKSGRMLLTAENGTGKSAIAMYIAACVITGTPLFGFKKTHKDKDFGNPVFPTEKVKRVLYLDYEIPEGLRWEERIKPLVETFGEKFINELFFPRIPSDYRLENGRTDKFNAEGAFDRLLAKAIGIEPGLLIIDPLSSTHSLDENSNEIKQALNNIDRLIDHSKTAVILVHHASTKILRDSHGNEIEKGAKEKARGHSAITDWADVHLHIEELKDKNNPKTVKTLSLDFAKTRYSRRIQSRAIKFNLETMGCEPVLRTDLDE
jgi:hypothetical protein